MNKAQFIDGIEVTGDIEVTGNVAGVNIPNLKAQADGLTDAQTGGLKSFTTLALLQAYATPNVNDSYKVTNDPTPANNGYYHWVSGTTYEKDALPYGLSQTLDPLNTTEAPSNKAVADYTATLRGGEVASGETRDVSGGEVFEHSKIANDLYDISYTDNLFNKENIVEGWYGSDGVTYIPNVNLWCSDFIQVIEGETYKRVKNSGLAYTYLYNSNGDLFQPPTAITEVIIPVGVTQVKCVFVPSILDTFMFTLASVDVTNYIPYSYIYIKEERLEFPFTVSDKEEIADTIDFKENLLERGDTINLLDLKNDVEGYVNTSTGIIESSATINTSDFIPVVEGETYTRATGTNAPFCFYDINKTVVVGGVNAGSVTIPVGVSFIRASFDRVNRDIEMIVNSNSYYEFYVPFFYQKLNKYAKKDQYHLVDKITYWLGDSIVENYDYFLNKLNEKLTFKEQYNLAVRGAVWSHKSTTVFDTDPTTADSDNNVIWNQVNKLIDLVNNNNYPIPELIIIPNGTNDFTLGNVGVPVDVYDGLIFTNLSSGDVRLQNVSGGVRYSCDKILDNYPDVQIILVAPIQRSGVDISKIFEITDTMKECGGYGSMEVIDQARRAGIYNYPEIAANKYLVDGLHPNEAGGQKMADFLFKALNNIITE